MSDVSLEGMSEDAIKGLAMLGKQLAGNPETRTAYLGLAKKVNPHLSIPEVDVPVMMDAKLAEERQKREALEQQMMKEKIEREVKERRDALMQSKGLSKEDVAEIEKLMVEKNIASHETAADFYKMQKQTATPTPSFSGFGSQQVPKPDLKEFGGNIGQWARNEAAATIHGIRTGSIKV